MLLANVKVEFRRSGSMHSGGAFTDRDGNFECLVGSLVPKTFEVKLFVFHRDWALTAMDLGQRIIPSLPANASDEEADGEGERIVLGPYSAVVRYGYTVTGTVSDPRGAPLEGVQLLHHEAHGSRKIKFLGRTRADGQFRLEHLRPDASLTLTLFHPDFAPLEVARPAGFAADGQLADLGTVLLDPGGTIKGVVREADGSPLVYRYVTVDGHFFQAPARTDAAGGFVLDHVAPGTRSLRVLRGSGNLWDGGRPTEDVDPVDVESGTTRHVELRLRE